MTGSRWRALLPVVALVLLLAVPGSAGARGFATGFFDPEWLGANGARFDEARAIGATFARIQVDWSAVAARRPADPANAADPAYRWSVVDTAVAGARMRGLSPVLSIDHAPAWAEGADRPATADKGSWKPDPAAVGTFSGLVAQRYRGQARYVQLWNEPNLARYLAPQATAPRRYRAMINAAYTAVHAAGLRLVGAGASPFGGNGRTRPMRFWRRVLKKKTRFDVFAHQPYSIGRPAIPASKRGDVTIADVHKLVRLVRRKVKTRKALPHRRKPIWVTEISWDSNPPDPNGVPERTRARWLVDAFALLWHQGVDHVFWTRVRDEPEGQGYPFTYQSGLYLVDGTPKLGQRAFAFPFSCRRGRHRTNIWLKAPQRGVVSIKKRRRTVARIRVRSSRIGTGRIRVRGRLTATIGTQRSLSCRA